MVESLRRWRSSPFILIALLVVLTLAVHRIPRELVTSFESIQEKPKISSGRANAADVPVVLGDSKAPTAKPSRAPSLMEPLFHCPAQPTAPSSYDASSHAVLDSLDDYLSYFRRADFDHWGRTYDQVKAGMKDWKISQYQRLKDGAMIYESACGIGLNLYMTLELLGLHNVTVYGNDYEAASVETARKLLPALGLNLGQVCAADSTNLSHVPSDTFDLVYTGYITPHPDPLRTGLSTQSDLDRYYMAACRENATLRDQAQAAQDAWYTQWVHELVRIAKPGASILMEQVSHPLCEALFDWGGVSPDLFATQIQGVRPKIVYANDTLFTRRYHVHLIKRMGAS